MATLMCITLFFLWLSANLSISSHRNVNPMYLTSRKAGPNLAMIHSFLSLLARKGEHGELGGWMVCRVIT